MSRTSNQLHHLFISVDSPSAMSSPTPVAHKIAHGPRPKLNCHGLVFVSKYQAKESFAGELWFVIIESLMYNEDNDDCPIGDLWCFKGFAL